MKAFLLSVVMAVTATLAHAEDMAEMISQYRRQHGLSTVRTDPQLTAIAEFLTRGYYDSHVETMQRATDARYQACLSFLEELMPDGVRWTAPGGPAGRACRGRQCAADVAGDRARATRGWARRAGTEPDQVDHEDQDRKDRGHRA